MNTLKKLGVCLLAFTAVSGQAMAALGDPSAIGTEQSNEQPLVRPVAEQFASAGHYHAFACDKTGTLELKIGIDLEISETDLAAKFDNPEDTRTIHPRALKLVSELMAAWNTPTAEIDFMASTEEQKKSFYSSANAAMVQALKSFEDDTGVSVRTRAETEGFAMGQACR